jgi:hypothetical protein
MVEVRIVAAPKGHQAQFVQTTEQSVSIDGLDLHIEIQARVLPAGPSPKETDGLLDYGLEHSLDRRNTQI